MAEQKREMVLNAEQLMSALLGDLCSQIAKEQDSFFLRESKIQDLLAGYIRATGLVPRQEDAVDYQGTYIGQVDISVYEPDASKKGKAAKKPAAQIEVKCWPNRQTSAGVPGRLKLLKDDFDRLGLSDSSVEKWEVIVGHASEFARVLGVQEASKKDDLEKTRQFLLVAMSKLAPYDDWYRIRYPRKEKSQEYDDYGKMLEVSRDFQIACNEELEDRKAQSASDSKRAVASNASRSNKFIWVEKIIPAVVPKADLAALSFHRVRLNADDIVVLMMKIESSGKRASDRIVEKASHEWTKAAVWNSFADMLFWGDFSVKRTAAKLLLDNCIYLEQGKIKRKRLTAITWIVAIAADQLTQEDKETLKNGHDLLNDLYAWMKDQSSNGKPPIDPKELLVQPATGLLLNLLSADMEKPFMMDEQKAIILKLLCLSGQFNRRNNVARKRLYEWNDLHRLDYCEPLGFLLRVVIRSGHLPETKTQEILSDIASNVFEKKQDRRRREYPSRFLAATESLFDEFGDDNTKKIIEEFKAYQQSKQVQSDNGL